MECYHGEVDEGADIDVVEGDHEYGWNQCSEHWDDVVDNHVRAVR